MSAADVFAVLAGALVVAGAGALWYFLSRAKKRSAISGSLGTNLYTILVPQDADEKSAERGHDPKDTISVMEQLYAGMMSLTENQSFASVRARPTFAFEIALPSVGEETAFYAAVPRK